MKLKYNKKLEENLWEKYGISMMMQLDQEIQDQYQFIFQTKDIKTLRALDNPYVKERIELIIACTIESQIKLALDEKLKPGIYQTDMPNLDTIEITSFYQLGAVHKIQEAEKKNGFQLSRFYRSNPTQIIDSICCHNLDNLISSLIEFEGNLKKKKAIPIVDLEEKAKA